MEMRGGEGTESPPVMSERGGVGDRDSGEALDETPAAMQGQR